MRIVDVKPTESFTLQITTDDGRIGVFDVRPYFQFEVFAGLENKNAFDKIMNGGYFVEWDCGADLSADTIEAHLILSS